MNSEVLSENFGDEYPLLVDVINSLLVDVSMLCVNSRLEKRQYTRTHVTDFSHAKPKAPFVSKRSRMFAAALYEQRV